MRDFARHIYQSPQWKRVRAYIIQRDDGLCRRCGEPGSTVHHIIHLKPKNINDPTIVFGGDNLELLCKQCHGMEHEGERAVTRGLLFDAAGNLVECTPPPTKN